jgi:hypothetical protein
MTRMLLVTNIRDGMETAFFAVLLLLCTLARAEQKSPPTTQAAQKAMLVHFEEFEVPGGKALLKPTDSLPANARSVASLETAVTLRTPYHAVAVIGGRKLEISGAVFKSDDDFFRVEMKFEDREGTSCRSVSSSLMFKPSKSPLIVGLMPDLIIVVKLSNEQ